MEDYKVTITVQKLQDNIKRYFWILLVMLVIGVGVCVVLGEKDNSDSESDKYEIQKIFCVSTNFEENVEENITEVINEDYLSDISFISSTKVFGENIQNEMRRQGFIDYVFSFDAFTMSISGNVISITIQENTKDMTETLGEIYSKEIVDKVNSFLDRSQISLNTELSEEIAQPITDNDANKGEILVKYTFILCLSLLFALIIIFVLTLFDDYFREQDEVAELKGVEYLGKIYRDTKKNNWYQRTLYYVEHFLQKNSDQEICFVTFKKIEPDNNPVFRLYKDISAKVDSVKISYYEDFFSEYSNLDKVHNMKIISFIVVNRDRIPDIEEKIHLLKAAGKKINAFVCVI